MATNRKLGLCNSTDADYHYDEDYQPNKDSVTKLIEMWKKVRSNLTCFGKCSRKSIY